MNFKNEIPLGRSSLIYEEDERKIASIISIMFCSFDIFGLEEPIYEIKRIVNETKVVSDNGVREIYVNLTADVKSDKLKELFNILTKLDHTNKKLFPKLTETKIKYSGLKGGNKKMSGLTREIYIDGYETGEKRGEAKGIIEGMKGLLIELYNKNIITKEYAAEKLNITSEEFLELVK